MTASANDRRLIEDYLPLDVLNAISAKEMSHPKHPVALVHYWPARRPSTASRVAIYAALTPAPRDQKERDQAVSFLQMLASFKPDPETIEQATDAIISNNGGTPPKVLDLFAGRGVIPLEAARLGCEAHSIDYNPVAHLVQLCTLVYPQRFGPSLADDLERWSLVVLDRMRKELQDLYPPVQIPETKDVLAQTNLFRSSYPETAWGAEPVAYIWARTVPCRRPGCDAQVPLVRQAWLRKKGGAVAAVPRIENGRDLRWEVVSGSSAKEVGAQDSQTGAGQAVCVACNTPVSSDYVKEMSKAENLAESLATVVVDGRRSKLYLPPNATVPPNNSECIRRLTMLLEKTGLTPLDEQMNTFDSTTVAGRGYGISQWQELFTPRQLLALFTLVKQIRLAHAEMLDRGMAEDRARALATYFAMAFGRLSNSFNKFCRWKPRDQITIPAVGDRQALKMVYDFSEINPFADTAGCLPFAMENEAYCIRYFAQVYNPSVVTRGSADRLLYMDGTFDAVITDPPYYSSIYYAELSAFFYVWLKRIVGDLYPEHFTLPTPPKRREAVAQPSEHGGDGEKADTHYQSLMRRSFEEARRVLKPGAPLVCVYAHKTTEGWATLILCYSWNFSEAGWYWVPPMVRFQRETPRRITL